VKAKLSAALAAILILSMVGCATSPIDLLNLAIGAAEVALPLVGGAAHVDPAVVTAVEGYLSAASQAIGQASDILAGPGTDAQKAVQIAAAFAGIAAPVVPGQYQSIANAVQAVAGYIAKFLASLPAPSAATANAMAVTAHPISPANRAKLASIKARADALHARLKK
jgi:hypothetical protein